MKHLSLLIFLFLAVPVGFLTIKNLLGAATGAPPYYVDEEINNPDKGKYAWLDAWTRPDAPPTVGLQVGHWKNDEIPEELHRLRGNTGAEGGGKSEWEVNHQIAMLTKEILEEEGIVVDILPATVPKQYWADVFVSVHADGAPDPFKSGYKVASPWRDFTNKADKLVDFIEASYSAKTKLSKDENITSNMKGYYAFSFWRFEHAVHPMTTSSILETGFLTNYSDRQIIVNRPELSAEGLADGIIEYLKSEGLIEG